MGHRGTNVIPFKAIQASCLVLCLANSSLVISRVVDDDEVGLLEPGLLIFFSKD